MQDERHRLQAENARKELATKMDVAQTETRIKAELTEKIETSKNEILKWMMGLIIAQAALIISVVAFLK